MATTAADLERRKVTQLAAEYRDRGYTVVIEPSADDVPSFISPYRPDLIAKGRGETVVVEVKAGSQTPAELEAVVAAINARDGWRFELVLLNDATQLGASELIPVDDLTKILPEAEGLLDRGFLGQALVLLWPATEGALRHAAHRRGLDKDLEPLRLIRRLGSLGIITEAELQLVDRCASVRNRLAHGFQSELPDKDLVRRLLRFTQRLLDAGETGNDSFDFPTVAAWVKSTLRHFTEYRLEDEVFARDSVIVRASDNSEFFVTIEDWTDLEGTVRRGRLRASLERWAADHLRRGVESE